jgi:hypothetical protein
VDRYANRWNKRVKADAIQLNKARGGQEFMLKLVATIVMTDKAVPSDHPSIMTNHCNLLTAHAAKV